MDRKDELKIAIFDIMVRQERMNFEFAELNKQKEILIKELSLEK
jgi:hypothetical protein